MMDQQQINALTFRMSMVDAEGNELTKLEIPYVELSAFRKANGAPPSLLIENMLGGLANKLMYGEGENKVALPPRKPGDGEKHNR